MKVSRFTFKHEAAWIVFFVLGPAVIAVLMILFDWLFGFSR